MLDKEPKTESYAYHTYDSVLCFIVLIPYLFLKKSGIFNGLSSILLCDCCGV